MRQNLKFLVLIMCLSLISSNANAAVKAGMACTKVGTTATANGKKFTCIKSGKKLVWNKGVAVAPKSTAIPTATQTPASNSPSDPIAPTSFEDIVERYKGIGPVVWKEAQALSLSGTQKSEFEIQIGPSTTPSSGVSNPNIYLARISKLWR